jgi:hypothetical protein
MTHPPFAGDPDLDGQKSDALIPGAGFWAALLAGWLVSLVGLSRWVLA